jgi:hypothetical protein
VVIKKATITNPKIFLLEPNKTPLTTLLTNVGKVYDGKSWTGAGMQKATCTQPEFTWFYSLDQ